jgi:hypothetical protein
MQESLITGSLQKNLFNLKGPIQTGTLVISFKLAIKFELNELHFFKEL